MGRLFQGERNRPRGLSLIFDDDDDHHHHKLQRGNQLESNVNNFSLKLLIYDLSEGYSKAKISSQSIVLKFTLSG